MLTKQQIKSAGSIFYANSAGCNPSINVIEALAESLQHAPTEPGAQPAPVDGTLAEFSKEQK